MGLPKIRIQIDGGAIKDMEKDMGFYLMASDDILEPPTKGYETENYPDKDGVDIYPYTTYKEFDYKITFGYFGTVTQTNSAIVDLFKSFYSNVGGLKKAKEITIYNDYKEIKIVGYPKEYKGKESLIEYSKGVVIFEFTIFVANPNKCTFK